MLALTNHKEPMKEVLLSLDQESRALRFMSAVNDYAILDFCDNATPEFVLSCNDEDTGEIIGVGEIHKLQKDGEVELALSVKPERQGQGHGGKIFEEAVSEAARRGFRRMKVYFADRNTAVLHLCRNYGASINREDGAVSAWVNLSSSC